MNETMKNELEAVGLAADCAVNKKAWTVADNAAWMGLEDDNGDRPEEIFDVSDVRQGILELIADLLEEERR